MMYNYPYFSFPYFRRYTVPSYNYYSKNTTSIKKNSHESSQEFCNKSSSNIKKIILIIQSHIMVLVF